MIGPLPSELHPLVAFTPVRWSIGAKVTISEIPDAWYDVELVVDLLVYGSGDDPNFREGVGHRMDPHLSHQQGQQEDLILSYIVVQQNSDRHERSSSGGHGAVHEDDVVFTDVFWQTKVMKLWFSCVMIGLNEDLSKSDVFTHSHQSLLHGLSRPQDRNTRYSVTAQPLPLIDATLWRFHRH